MIADLDALRAEIGTVSNVSNTLLEWALTTAREGIRDRVMASHFEHPEVQQAIIKRANRLYKRRQSPEGVAGWGDLGVVRILPRDPDEERLLEEHLDYCKAGVA